VKRKIAIYISIICLALCLGACNNGSDAGNTDANAQSGVGIKYSEKDNKKIDEIINSAEELANSGDYKGAWAKIKSGLMSYPKASALESKLDEYNQKLTNQTIQDALNEAGSYAANKDYLSAMSVLESALNQYPDNAELKSAYDGYSANRVDQVKQEILDEAARYTAENNFSSAIAVLEDAINNYPEDTAFSDALKNVVKAYKEYVLNEASTMASSGDELGAYKKVNSLISEYPDDTDVSTALASYKELYINRILTEADTAMNNGEYSLAQKVVGDALVELPDDEKLIEANVKVNLYKNDTLNSLSPINGGFTWNDGTPEDPFGTVYNDLKNYTMLHGTGWNNHGNGATYSAEYKIDSLYNELTFNIVPYSDFGQTAESYILIYADNVLRYTSSLITQKTQPYNVKVDVTNATYLKIEVRIGDYGCLMLSDVILSASPEYVSTIDGNVTSLSTYEVFNGSISWQKGFPQNIKNDSYNNVKNYTTFHGTGWNNHSKGTKYSTEYYLNQGYQSLSLDIAPYTDFGSSASSIVKIYADDRLVYTSPKITKKTSKFNTGDIDVSNANYIKIVAEIGGYGCIIVSDALLVNKIS
jgi:tetratricopeptide (TPR) repeat protein